MWGRLAWQTTQLPPFSVIPCKELGVVSQVEDECEGRRRSNTLEWRFVSHRMGNTVCMYQSGSVNVGNVGFYLLIWAITPETGLEEPCAPDVICSFLGINFLPSLPRRFWICSSILWLWQNSRGWIPHRGREWGIIFRQTAQIFSLYSWSYFRGTSQRFELFTFTAEVTFSFWLLCFDLWVLPREREAGGGPEGLSLGLSPQCHHCPTQSPQPQYLLCQVTMWQHEPNLLPPSLHAAFFTPFSLHFPTCTIFIITTVSSL